MSSVTTSEDNFISAFIVVLIHRCGAEPAVQCITSLFMLLSHALRATRKKSGIRSVAKHTAHQDPPGTSR